MNHVDGDAREVVAETALGVGIGMPGRKAGDGAALTGIDLDGEAVRYLEAKWNAKKKPTKPSRRQKARN